jgi:predicted AAA+ superfamily ATPase
MANIKLRRFNPQWMEDRRTNPSQGPPSIVIIGSKRTGKTTLIQDIMYFFRKIPAGCIVTGSMSSAEKFSKFFPPSCIFDNVDDQFLARVQSIVEGQEKLRKKRTKQDYSCFILFDDCGFDEKFSKKEIIRKLFMNGRHVKVLIIMAIQYCKSIPPTLRSNIDYIFVMKQTFPEQMKKLHETVTGMIEEIKDFRALMKKYTSNFGCLVIDNTSTSTDVLDMVYHYRASFPPRKFKVGSKELWECHTKYYIGDANDSDSVGSVKS